MVNLIVWLVAGVVIGWIASDLMEANRSQGIVLDIVVSIVGAVVAGWIVAPEMAVSTIYEENLSFPALLASLLGAWLLLGMVGLFRGARERAQ